jgi:hypothetical protein
MINNLKINYISEGIQVTLSYEDTYSDNLPYDLATMFKKVIEDSDANPEIVINELKDNFNVE